MILVLVHQLVLAQKSIIFPLKSNLFGLCIVNLHAVTSDKQSHLMF